MKNLIFTLMFALFSIVGFSQNSRTVEQLDNDLFKVKLKSGSTKQIGYAKKVEGEIIKHGRWTLWVSGKKTIRGEFKDNSLVEITIFRDGTKKTYNKTDLELIRLKRQIYRLENMLITSSY